MGKRIERTGMELEMEVMRQCAERLKKLPRAARCRVADWLQQSALDDASETTVAVDTRQTELGFGG